MIKLILVCFVLLATVFPVFTSAQINLNLDYPEFGNVTLDKAECERIEADIKAGIDPGKVCGQNLNIVAWLYYLIVGIAGLAAFVMIVWGGIQWLTSGAIPSQASEARDKLRAAILGLLLILASFLILQVINPQLTILNQPGLEQFFGEVPGVNLQGPAPGSGSGSGGAPVITQFDVTDNANPSVWLPGGGVGSAPIYTCCGSVPSVTDFPTSSDLRFRWDSTDATSCSGQNNLSGHVNGATSNIGQGPVNIDSFCPAGSICTFTLQCISSVLILPDAVSEIIIDRVQ